MQAARLGALVGFAGTSNVAAATALDIPASGTMAHWPTPTSRRSPAKRRRLLRTVMRGGRRIWSPDHWQKARKRFHEDLATLPGPALRIEDPEPVPPVWSAALARLTASVRADVEARLRPEGRVAPSDTADSRSVPLSAHTH